MPTTKKRVPIIPSTAGHIGCVVRALVESGWKIDQAPKNGRLSRNWQLIKLVTPRGELRVRIAVYTVTGSSRGRKHERRVEITTTYQGSLVAAKGYTDIVLGYDASKRVFVGLDPARLHHGGETTNASSFLENGGLNRSEDAPFVILLHRTRLFPEGEYQAFFRPERLSEYLFNLTAIHSDAYRTTGAAVDAPPLAPDWSTKDLGDIEKSKATGTELVLTRDTELKLKTAALTTNALEEIASKATGKKRRGKKLSPEELKAIQQRLEENGFLGEQFVFEEEKKVLKRKGRHDLAEKVDWISKRSVGEGYDILSYDSKTNLEKYIEVKSSEGNGSIFDISVNEWNVAEQYKDQYFIYRVTNVRAEPTIDHKLKNPIKLAKNGKLEVTPSGWRVNIKG